MWKVYSAVLLAGLITVTPAMAMERGTLGKIPSASWATPVSDRELGSMRGGFGGLAFSVAFTGTVDNVGNVQGFLSVDPGATQNAPPPTFSNSNGQVNIQTSIGNFEGASGIFQITQVPGSFNVVNNNLFIQIAVVNLVNTSTLPPLSTIFGTPGP